MNLKNLILILFTSIFALQSCEKKEVSKSGETDTAINKDSAVISPMAHVMDSANLKPFQKFSILKNRDFPVVDSAIVLKPLTELSTENSYLLFNKDQSKAEIFLPNAEKSKIMERKGKEGNYTWTDGKYQLIPWKGYILRTLKDETPLFGGDSM